MRLSVYYRGKTISLDVDKEEITVKEIITKLNLSMDYAFVIVNGEMAEEGQKVSIRDDVKVFNAISGG